MDADSRRKLLHSSIWEATEDVRMSDLGIKTCRSCPLRFEGCHIKTNGLFSSRLIISNILNMVDKTNIFPPNTKWPYNKKNPACIDPMDPIYLTEEINTNPDVPFSIRQCFKNPILKDKFIAEVREHNIKDPMC
jgi:hypothetical protein